MVTVFVKESGHRIVVLPENVDKAIFHFSRLFPQRTIKVEKTRVEEGIDFGCMARVFGDVDDTQIVGPYRLYLN